MPPHLVVTGRRVVIDGEVRPATIGIDGGRIVAVDLDHEPPTASRGDVIDAGDLVVLPGLVDSHVHVNEPGRTEWEGFETATRAAAAGGTTTIVDMPLNSIPPPSPRRRRRRSGGRPSERPASTSASGAAWCRATPGQLEPMTRAGVCGFKAFLVDSGVEEFPRGRRRPPQGGAARAGPARTYRCSSTPRSTGPWPGPLPASRRPMRGTAGGTTPTWRHVPTRARTRRCGSSPGWPRPRERPSTSCTSPPGRRSISSPRLGATASR